MSREALGAIGSLAEVVRSFDLEETRRRIDEHMAGHRHAPAAHEEGG